MRCLGSSFFAAYRIRHGECVWKAGESRLQVGCELWLCQFYTFYFNWMITKLVTCSRLLAHSSRFGRHWRHRLRRRRCNLNASPHQVDWGIDTPTDRQTDKQSVVLKKKKEEIDNVRYLYEGAAWPPCLVYVCQCLSVGVCATWMAFRRIGGLIIVYILQLVCERGIYLTNTYEMQETLRSSLVHQSSSTTYRGTAVAGGLVVY